MKQIFIIIFSLHVAFNLNAQSGKVDSHTVLHSLFNEIAEYEKSLSKWDGFYGGSHPDKIGYDTEEDYKNQLSSFQQFLETLQSINVASLDNQDVISMETMELKLSGKIGKLSHQLYHIPFNAEGGFFNAISRGLKNLPFATLDDFQKYKTWLPSWAEYIKGHQRLMQSGIDKGIVAPKVIVHNFIKQVKPWTSQAQGLSESPLTAMLTNAPEGISTTDFEQVKVDILNIMLQKVWPAYDELHRFASEEYLSAAPAAPGISNATNGRSYYEDRVSYFTTLDVTPDDVYQVGEKEVARIRAQMEDVIEELEYKGTFDEFVHFLRTDEQFYAKTPQELLSYAAWLSKKAEGQLPRLFSHLYKLPFTVEPVPDDIAPTYTGGRYVQGNRGQDRPGIYWVNTYNLPARSLYNIPALTVHEAVPGHHLQIMLAAELKDIPDFRKRFYISAFGEGWGLYSEYLGEEMGMYETPYDRFGRYTYEMWRACRLVVDVGLHYKGWTREQAVEFLASNTALSLHEVNTEIDRYIGWPGQALSYKMGEITIKNLREKAAHELGDKFDIKEFHFQILKNGSVPLPTLMRIINDWIASK